METTNEVKHTGRCFCGLVEIEAVGAPEAMGYCHCDSCRQWSAAPVNAFTLWRPEAVRVVRGREHLGTYRGSARSHRRWCTACGGHLLTDHPEWRLVDVYAATLPGLGFKPAVHVNYRERVLPMADGLPKLADFPRELGGTGATMAE